MSETSKYRHLTVEHCQGNGVDIGSGGDPVVKHAIQIDLPPQEFEHYNSGKRDDTIQFRGYAGELPFKDEVLDFVYSSHLIEDFEFWGPLLREWVRVLKPGGKLIILLPDKERWNAAIRNGQPPNCAHCHESYPGELSTYAEALRVTVLTDGLTECFEGDYNILFVATKN